MKPLRGNDFFIILLIVLFFGTPVLGLILRLSLLYIVGILIIIFVVVLIYSFLQKKEMIKSASFSFLVDHLKTGSGLVVQYKDITSVKIYSKADYYTGLTDVVTWFPVVIMSYKLGDGVEIFEIPISYQSKAWYYSDDVTGIDYGVVKKLADHVPEKIDQNLKDLLAGKILKFSTLEKYQGDDYIIPPQGELKMK